MADRRSYGDSCGIARGLDVAGERWALLVVRELLLGPKRFTDLREGLSHVSPDVLAQRLRELEQSGLVRRRKLPPPAAAKVYELTERGAELEPVLLALGRWGSGVPLSEEPSPLSPDALAVALKTMFDPAAAAGRSGVYELRFGEHAFTVRLTDGELDLARRDTSAPDTSAPDTRLALNTDTATLAGLLWHGGSLTAAIDAGALELDGDQRELASFLTLFAAI
jgi:DNA-binding HxlR family transcriptional regulator